MTNPDENIIQPVSRSLQSPASKYSHDLACLQVQLSPDRGNLTDLKMSVLVLMFLEQVKLGFHLGLPSLV